MNVSCVADSPSFSAWADEVRSAWREHPLRQPAIDDALANVTLLLVPGADYALNSDHYPTVSLLLPEAAARSAPECRAYIAHELTHLIDRHDTRFAGSLSSGEIDRLIGSLAVRKHASVRHAFIAYWNAYIDGRLERRGIFVRSFDDRLEEKVGTMRFKDGLFTSANADSLALVWNSEPHSFAELRALAQTFPYSRPPRYRLREDQFDGA